MGLKLAGLVNSLSIAAVATWLVLTSWLPSEKEAINALSAIMFIRRDKPLEYFSTAFAVR
jgi:hypothetical protein